MNNVGINLSLNGKKGVVLIKEEKANRDEKSKSNKINFKGCVLITYTFFGPHQCSVDARMEVQLCSHLK